MTLISNCRECGFSGPQHLGVCFTAENYCRPAPAAASRHQETGLRSGWLKLKLCNCIFDLKTNDCC